MAVATPFSRITAGLRWGEQRRPTTRQARSVGTRRRAGVSCWRRGAAGPVGLFRQRLSRSTEFGRQVLEFRQSVFDRHGPRSIVDV